MGVLTGNKPTPQKGGSVLGDVQYHLGLGPLSVPQVKVASTTPSKPSGPSNAAKVGNVLTGIGKSIVKPFKDTAESAASNRKDTVKYKANDIIKFQTGAKKALQGNKYSQTTKDLINKDKTAQGNIEAFKMISEGKSDAEVQGYLTKQVKGKQNLDKKMVGTAAEIVSMGVGAGEGASVLHGAQVLKPVLTSAAAGTAGGVGSVAADNPDATLGEYIKGGAIGGLAGAAFPVLGQVGRTVLNKIPGVHAAEDVIKTGSMADGATRTKLGEVPKVVSKELLDKNAPVKDLVGQIQQIIGRPLRKEDNPNELLKLRAGVEGQAVTHLEQTAGWMKDVPKTLRNDGDAYNYAKQYLSQGSKRTPEQLATARNTIKSLTEKYGGDVSQLEDYGAKTRQAFDSLVDLYHNNGLIDDARAQKLHDNPDYFAKMEVLQDESPLQMSNGGSVSTREAKGLLSIKGQSNGARLAHASEAYVAQTLRAFKDVANNKVGKAFGDLAESKTIESGLVLKPRGSNKAFGQHDVPKGYTKISYLDKGERKEIALPKEVGDILTNASPEQFDRITTTVSKITNVFRQSVTTYNPLFTFFRNPIRDFKSFLVNSRYVPVHKAITAYSSALMDSLTNGQWTKEFLQSGGGQAGYFAREGGQAGKAIAKQSKELTGKRTIAGRVVTSPRDFMQFFSGAIEQAPRVAEYKAARAAGESTESAAIAGREVTVDFAQGGELAKLANQWVPFLNARTQGIRRTAQAFKENPKRAITVYAATTAAPMAALMAWNKNNFPDVWNNMSAQDKSDNFVIIFGDKKDGSGRYTQLFKIPKGDVDKVLGNTFETMLDQFTSKGGNIGGKIGGSLLDAASNVSPVSFSRGGKFSPGDTLSGVTPSVVKEPIQQLSNHDLYTGEDIVPGNIVNDDPRTQVKPNTSSLAKGIGKVTGQSPLRVDHAINAFAGNVPADVTGGPKQAATRNERGILGSSGNDTESQFYKIYSPLRTGADAKKRQIMSMIYNGKTAQAERTASEWNKRVDERFNDYYKTNGSKVDPSYAERVGNLKIDVKVSKKGRPYIPY